MNFQSGGKSRFESKLRVLRLRLELKPCLRDALFSAVAMFEAKKKGYSFIPNRFTVKVRAKSKGE